jgi:hypothetical protein
LPSITSNTFKATFAGQVLLWPLPIYGAQFIFSKKVETSLQHKYSNRLTFLEQLFIAWVVVALIWLFVTLIIANLYPLADGGLQKIWQVVMGKHTSTDGRAHDAGDVSPVSLGSGNNSAQEAEKTKGVSVGLVHA